MILQCIDFRHSPQELAGLGDREARDTIVFVDLCPGNIGYMCTCILAYTVAHIQAQVQDGDREHCVDEHCQQSGQRLME